MATRILIVDDSKAMRMIVTRTLRQAGFGDAVLVEAANGVEALASVKAEAPDLILCDWNMPEMNGIDFLIELRKQGIGTKFGFVTSEGTPEMRARAIQEGAEFLIAKPFTADTFQQHLAAVLA